MPRDVQARAAARGGLHGRDQAEPGDRARQPAARRGDHRGRAAGWRRQHRARRPRGRAPTWSNTRTSTRSRSPARAHRVARSRGAAESCCARSRWSSAASPPRSSSTTPTSPQSAEALFGATLANNGQTCYIGTRVLAPRSRYDEVVEVFSGLAGALQVGDSLDPATQIGPMVSARQRERVEGYIEKGRAEGGRVVAGGGRPAEPGARLVRAADDLRRRGQQRHDRPRGDLRAGARGDPLRRRR